MEGVPGGWFARAGDSAPHVAAGTRDALMEKLSFVFGNLERYWRGDPVENLVDLSPAPERAA